MKLETIQFTAILENLPKLLDFVEEQAARSGMSSSRITKVLIALEEAFVNICRYAYEEGEGDVWVSCSKEDDRFMLEIADAGKSFDLESLPDPELGADLNQRKVGGLGVFCMRNLADEMRSFRAGNKNILQMQFSVS